MREAVGRARAAGVLVSFAINRRTRLWTGDEAAEVCGDLLSQADIVFAGEDEARLLARVSTPPT